MASDYAGTYRAIVVGDIDPIRQLRLQVVVPDVYGDVPVWAAASLLPGGTPLPGVGDEVWVSFEHGDVERPVWEFAPVAGQEAATGYIGKFRGVVVDNADPLQQGRVEVTVPEVNPSPQWALPPVEDVRPTQLPGIGARVWIEYDNGDVVYPRWVGLADVQGK